MGNMQTGSRLKFRKTIPAATATGTQTGTAVDRQGAAHHHPCFIADIGNSGDTLSGTVYIEVRIEESDDNVTWNAAPNNQVLPSVTGGTGTVGTAAIIDAPAEDDLIVKVEYMGKKRWCRNIIALIGTHTNGTPVVGYVATLEPEFMPAT